jgi:histidine triad (HIT) family protein
VSAVRWCGARNSVRKRVSAAVIGHGVPHLHIHLLPRFPGTPREYWWTRAGSAFRVTEWPEAQRGGVEEIKVLVSELNRWLAK